MGKNPAKPRDTNLGRYPQLTQSQARAIWLAAQKLDVTEPFGAGPDAVAEAIAHLGYVQIDTINVIERCHHHILFNRIPHYRRVDLEVAQSGHKSVFEYWTHALSYVPATDLPYFLPEMKRHRSSPSSWYKGVTKKDINRIFNRIRQDGALSIADITDDVAVDKDHPWASRKPSKRILESAFYNGQLAISRRRGMLKTYELMDRHFGWDKPPKPATEAAISRYLLQRSLRAQGLVSLDSICHLNAPAKPAMAALITKQVRAKRLREIRIEGLDGQSFWVEPKWLDWVTTAPKSQLTHILSPFDPLIIQRKRTAAIFGYDHLFEAYIPAAKRKLGYFTLPVLSGDEIVSAIDLKADRQNKKLLIQAWHWVGSGHPKAHKAKIDAALDDFAAFQFRD